MKRAFILALVLSSPLLYAQQSTLTIQLRSENHPVPNGKVTVNGVDHSADAAGNLVLNVAPGPVEVIGQAPDLAPASTQLILQSSEHRTVTLQLERHEEEVTVSATRTDARVDEQPTRVEVLEREEIEEKMLMTPGDIVMMLNEMGGLRVQATSPSLGAASVRIQGMRGRYTRFFSDGLPLYGQQVGGLGLLQVPPMDLAQVEVIKGVASSLYGSGAIGGIVNLVSRHPKHKTAEFLVNQTSRFGTDLVFFGSTPLQQNWSMTFLGSGHVQRRQDIDHDNWADLAHFRRGVFRPRFYWDNQKGSSLFITAGATMEEREGGTMNGLLLAGSPHIESLGTRSFDIGSVAQTLLGGKTVLSGRFAASRRNHDHLFGDVRERDHHDTVFSELTARRSFGPHTLVAGAAFERDAFSPREFAQFAYEHHVPGFFFQDDFTVAEWLSVSAGARMDHHSEYGTFFSPRLAFLIRRGAWSSRLAVGQGFYAPTPLTEETEAAGLSRLVIPRALRAERGRSATLDLTRTRGVASFTVTFFGSRVNDPAEVNRDTYRLVNLSQPTTNIGAEFLSTVRHGRLGLTASYTYVQSRQSEGGARLETSLTPKHSAGLVGMFEAHDNYRFGLELYYTGKQRLEQNPYRNISRPYFILGALVEKRFGPLRAFLNMENLTNIRQTRWDPLVRPTRSIDGRWTVDAWAPLDGRTFNGGIRFAF